MIGALRDPSVELTSEEIRRYGRHLVLPEVGVGGQKRLKRARVLAIGAGGLGSPLNLYLAAAGVGTIGIVDFDAVDSSNLQRQILYSTDSVGKPKLEAARERLLGINPNVRIETHETRLTPENALDLFRRYDVIADGTDNFPTRYLVNDACVLADKPNVYGSVSRFEGRVSVFWASIGPCYRCLYPEPPPEGLAPSCAEGGVLGVLPGIIGTLQAAETLKIILGIGEPLVGRLVLLDALKMEWRRLDLRKDPDCPVCGGNPSIRELADSPVVPACERRNVPMSADAAEISVEELRDKIERKDDFILIDVREPHEYDICRIPGSRLIPLGQLQDRVRELEAFKGKEIAVHCRSGGRSSRAAKILKDLGFSKAVNVAGGILAWSERIDPRVPQY